MQSFLVKQRQARHEVSFNYDSLFSFRITIIIVFITFIIISIIIVIVIIMIIIVVVNIVVI
jgi:hypothetical protein